MNESTIKLYDFWHKLHKAKNEMVLT